VAAQAAGIEPGDLIVRFDGKEIKDTAGLSQIVAETPLPLRRKDF
jgi:S1-C subfamily serine protease